MKRLSIVMLALLFVMASLMVSCDNNSNQVKDEVVEVRFGTKEEGRGLSASVPLESVDDPSLTWYYKATKRSQLDFVTGAAVKEELTLGEPITFSQGKWDFELLAEKDGKEVYWGKVDGVLITKADSPKTIVISVSPSIAGVNGAVQFNNVKIQKHSENSTTIETTAANTITLDGEAVTLVDGSAIIEDVEPGSHEVFVAYLADVDGNQIVYASETIFITVYSGRTTVISGNVSEEVGSADIGVVATSVQVTETVTVASDTTIEAGVAPYNATATAGDNDKKTTVTFPAGALTSTTETVSAVLSIDTQSIENNINITDGTTAVAGINVNLTVGGTPVTTFNDKEVTITTYIAKGLSSVKVYYGSELIAQDNDATDIYDPSTGKLTFTTTHFSQFDVSADAICFDPESNTGYSTIQAAIDASPINGTKKTIKLLKNVSEGGCFEFNGVTGKNIVLDLDNKTYTFATNAVGSTGFKTQAMHLEKDNKLHVMNGKLEVKEGNETITMLIQNYCDLTLENVKVNGSNLAGDNRYAMSNNHGNIVITGSTEIIAKENGYAFDVYYWPSNGYDDGVSVTLDENFTGIIQGTIQYGSDESTDGLSGVADKAKLVIKSGTIDGEIECYGLGSAGKKGISLRGGEYTKDPSACVEENYMVVKSGDKWIIDDSWAKVAYDDATGTYTIKDADQLVTFGRMVNEQGKTFSEKTIKLAKDIDLAGIEWKPVGQTGGYDAKTYFQGTFDGNGKTISNLNIPSSTWESGSNGGKNYATGFFGFIDMGGDTIKNVTFDNATVEGHHWVGVAVGYMTGTVSGVNVTNSTINSTYENGEADGDKAGGVVGYLNSGAISDCTVSGSTISAVRDCGSVVGMSNGSVTGNTAKDCSVYYSTDNEAQIGGEIAGKRSNGVSDNTVENVTVAKAISSSTEFASALKDNTSEDIVVVLGANVTYDVTPWIGGTGTMGGASTRSITINGNGHTITFNNTNSDWNSIYIANEDAILTINNAKITNSGHNDGPYNRHDINFQCKVILNNVVSDKAIAVAKNATLNQVDISDERDSDDYLLWIEANGSTVNITDCNLHNTKTGSGTTRGVAIKDQYVGTPASVTLNVSGTTFVTAKKAAVLVTSTAGANITWGIGNDISGVAADSINAVWNDSGRVAAWDLVTVTGCTIVQE